MTTVPVRARGILDPGSGALLALTWSAVTWIGSDGRRVDLTPEHAFDAAAAAGGAVVLAGEDRLTWWDGANARTLAAPGLYRVAAAGRALAGATVDGEVLVWRDVDSPAEHWHAALEPNEVALDVVRSRVAVWGARGRVAALATAEVRAGGIVADRPDPPWPEATGGVAFPLSGGALAVGSADGVDVLAPDGKPLRRLPLPGVEQLAVSASGATLAWIRTAEADSPTVAGGAGVPERPLPGDKSGLVHLAVTDAPAVVVIEGAAPDRLHLHRLTREGWAEPAVIDL
jgi:hypothetical protein